jgi:hypothetical protein
MGPRSKRGIGAVSAQRLRLGLKASVDCYTALIDGEPEAMLGLVPKNILEGEGAPWMLGRKRSTTTRGAMVLSRRMIAIWRDSLPNARNLVAAGNDRAIRYLRRLGFS